MPWLPLACWLLAGAVVASCGYRQDVPRLPAGAVSLAIGEVSNLTSTGELDVRLRVILKKRLRRRAHLRLRPPETSDLVLTVNLTEFTIIRALDPAIDQERAFSFRVTGVMRLMDMRSGKALIPGRALSAGATRHHPPTQLETPAIRDEGIADVLDSFAAQVERQLFLFF